MPPFTGLIIALVMFFVFGFIILTLLPDMVEDKVNALEPIENIEKQTLVGQITELSKLVIIVEGNNTWTYCIISFQNDLTEYKIHGLNQGQYELLDLAKTNQDQVTIDYELVEEQRTVTDVKVGVIEPTPEEKPFEFNWWLLIIPAIVAIVFMVGKPLIDIAIERHENKEQRKINTEKAKKAKIEKENIKKTKKAETERKSYKTEGRSSRTAKAAQLLDQQEGKKRRK